MTTGKLRRLHRLIAPTRHALWLAVDDSLISGPAGGLVNLPGLLTPRLLSPIDAVLSFSGSTERTRDRLLDCGVVENLTASTRNVNHSRKGLVATVEAALRRGADGVAFHFNATDDSELDSLQQLGGVSGECDKLGVPLCVIAYARRSLSTKDEDYAQLKADDPDSYARLLAHAVRIAVELGADVVKTQYTGSPDTFSQITNASLDVPILVAGGSSDGSITSARLAKEAIQAGAAGVCFGRRIFMTPRAEDEVELVRDALKFGGHTNCMQCGG